MGGGWRGVEDPTLPAGDATCGVVWRRVLWGWMGSADGQSRVRVYEDGEGRWVAYCRLGDPPGTSPVTTLPERFATADVAMRAAERYLEVHTPGSQGSGL